MFKHVKDWGPFVGYEKLLRAKSYPIGGKEIEALVTRIAAAYVFDRAQQFEESSGIHHALCAVAARLREDEHMSAFRAGELDDLLAKDSGRTDPEKKDPHT